MHHNRIYAGVELLNTAGRMRRAYVYAVLDDDHALLAIGQGDRSEVLAYLGGQTSACVAINAPRRPYNGKPTGAVDLLPLPTDSKDQPLAHARPAEVELAEMGFPVNFTPADVADCPRWMRTGFDLYERLTTLGYHPFSTDGSALMTLETHVEAVFWRWLGGECPLLTALEGRLQRQLILYEQRLPIADAMDFFLEITRRKLIQGDLPDQNIHPLEELNALAAAQIAWAAVHHPDSVRLLGDPSEGQIILPALQPAA